MRFFKCGKFSKDFSSQSFMVRYQMFAHDSSNLLIVGVIVFIYIPSKHSCSIVNQFPLAQILFLISVSALFGICLEYYRIQYIYYNSAQLIFNFKDYFSKKNIILVVIVWLGKSYYHDLIEIMFEEKKTLKKMDPFPIPPSDQEDNHKAEAKEKSESQSRSEKSHKNPPNRNHFRLATPAFPSINIDIGKGILSMKGHPCDFKQTDQKNHRSTSPQMGEQADFHIKKIDKQHLMRNFPLAYFENVDLLFKIVKKKKKFVKNTYKTQAISKNQQQNLKEFDELQSKPNDHIKQFVRSHEKNMEKGFGRQQCLNKQFQKQDKNPSISRRKYHQMSTISNNKNQKDERKQFKKTLSDRKFAQIDKNNPFVDEKRIEEKHNKNSLHTVLKEKSRQKQIDNYLKQSIEDDFLRNLTKKNSTNEDNNQKNTPVISKRNKFITHKKQITQVKDCKNKCNNQLSANSNLENRHQLIKLPENRKSQQIVSNISTIDPKMNQERSKSINKTLQKKLFTKKNAGENQQIANKDKGSTSNVTIYKGIKKQEKIENIEKRKGEDKSFKNIPEDIRQKPAQKSKFILQKNQSVENPTKQVNVNQKRSPNSKAQPQRYLKRNFSNKIISNSNKRTNSSNHVKLISQNLRQNDPRQSKSKINNQPQLLITKDNIVAEQKIILEELKDKQLQGNQKNVEKDQDFEDQSSKQQEKSQEVNHIPITQCNQFKNCESPDSFYNSKKINLFLEPKAIKRDSENNKKITEVSINSRSNSQNSDKQLQNVNDSRIEVNIEKCIINNPGQKLFPQPKNSSSKELTRNNLSQQQQKCLSSNRSFQKQNSLKITPVFNSKQSTTIKNIDQKCLNNGFKSEEHHKVGKQINEHEQNSNSGNKNIQSDEEYQKIEPSFSRLKVNLQKQSSKISPNCSNIDPDEINNFYDQILQLDVEQPTFYCPKMRKLTNLQNKNQQNTNINSNLPQQQQNLHQDNQINNESSNTLDKQMILYTSSKDIINSCDQNLPMTTLHKKKSNKISIISSSSQPRKVNMNKYNPNQRKQFKKALLNMPNDVDKQNLSDISVKQSQRHEESSDQQQVEKNNLSQSMICIDVNKKLSSPQQNKQRLFTNKISIQMVADPQQLNRIYSISINQIQNIPRSSLVRQERVSAYDSIEQYSEKDILNHDKSLLNEEKSLSDISLLKMTSEQQQNIDNDLQLVVIPVHEDLNSIYKCVTQCIEDIKKQEKGLFVPQNERQLKEINKFTSVQSHIPVKVNKKQSTMTQIIAKEQKFEEKSIKNSKSMKQIQKIEKNISQYNDIAEELALSNKQQKQQQKIREVQVEKQIVQFVEQKYPFQGEESRSSVFQIKESRLQLNKNQQPVQSIEKQLHNQEKKLINASSLKDTLQDIDCEKISKQNGEKKQTEKVLQDESKELINQSTQQAIIMQQSTFIEQKQKQIIKQPLNQLQNYQSVGNNTHVQKDDLSVIGANNHPQLEDNKKLDESQPVQNSKIINSNRSSFRNNNQLHKMYEINIFNQLSPVNSVHENTQNIYGAKKFDTVLLEDRNGSKIDNIPHEIKEQYREDNQLPEHTQSVQDKIELKQSQRPKEQKRLSQSNLEKSEDKSIKIEQNSQINRIHSKDLNPSTEFQNIPELQNQKMQQTDQKSESVKILSVKQSPYLQTNIIQDKPNQQHISLNNKQHHSQKQMSSALKQVDNHDKIQKDEVQIPKSKKNNHTLAVAQDSIGIFRTDYRQITFQKIKQISCLVEEQFIYPDQCLKTQKIISEQPKDYQVSQQQNTSQNHEVHEQRQKDRAITHKSTLKAIQHEQLTIRSTNMKDISTNTFDLIRKYSETSEKQLLSDEIAKISTLLSVFDKKRINNLEQKFNFPLFEQLWSIIMNIFNYLDVNNCYIDRIVDRRSVWLYNPLEKKSQFYRYSIPETSQMTRQQRVKQSLLRMLSINLNGSQAVKVILQSLTGMPVLILKQTCYNKLDNLYRHGNIFGFTFGKGEVWRIVGTLQSKKNSSQKKLRLQMLSSKEIKQISWKRFLQQFKYSFIAGFSEYFHLRSLKIDSKFSNSNPSIKLSIKQQSQDKKNHCIMGVSTRPSQSSQINGKMLVYGKTQSQKPGQQCFKYLGSGDIGLISMKLKKGQYIIVLELDQNNHGKQMELLLGSESKNIEIRLERK